MDLFLTILNHGGALVLLIAIFGVSAAHFALNQERRQRAQLPTPSEEWIWWQDLQELGYEIHLQNGETWRSLGRFEPLIWRHMHSNRPLPGQPDSKLEAYLFECLHTIKEGRAADKHAHQLVDWSALDGAYQLKLLNGSVWQFNVKSEGLGENNELAWHRISSPDGIVFEAPVRIYRALNDHLKAIRRQQWEAKQAQNYQQGSLQYELMGLENRSQLAADAAHRAAYQNAAPLFTGPARCGLCGTVGTVDSSGLCTRCG